MAKKRKIVDVNRDSRGKITHVIFDGNTRPTPLKVAIRIADRGGIENAHATHGKKIDPYLRSNPDNNKKNNLGEIGKTTKRRRKR